MNKIGLHCGYWRGTGRDGNVFDVLDLSSSTGVKVFEILPNMILNLSRQERAELKKAVEEKGMVFSFNGGLDPTNDISSDDSAIRLKGIEYCKRTLEAISEAGADRWSGINYSAWLRRPDKILDMDEKNRIRDLSIDSMHKIIKTAEDTNISYCFEVVNRFEQFLFNTSAEGVAFCEAVESPNAKLLLDVFHMNIEEDSPEDAIMFASQHGRLGHLHVAESNRRVPGIGKGHIAWPSIFSTLKKVNYQEYITMEPFVLMGNPSALKICVWRDLSNKADLNKLIDDASAGVSFINSLLANA
jgi:D-psicose/D-tagatose/L-ribulose 3-epimerase